MSVREIIGKIKMFLAEEIVAEEQNFVDVKTTDGLILSFDALEVGKEIFVVDQAGRTPAPDGEYTLEDGTILAVTGGMIEEISAPDAVEAPVEDTGAPAMPAGMPGMAELVAKVKKCEEDNLALAEVVKQLAESFSKQNFKEEVKMSMKKVEPEMVENRIKQKNTNLNSIFSNMYK